MVNSATHTEEMGYEGAAKIAENLNSYAQNMDEEFAKLKKEMDDLENVLKSKGGTDLYNAYKELETKISDYPNKVRDFSKFLATAKATYVENDQDLSREISSSEQQPL